MTKPALVLKPAPTKYSCVAEHANKAGIAKRSALTFLSERMRILKPL